MRLMPVVVDESGEERLNRTKTIRVCWELPSGIGPVEYRDAGVGRR